ncbi:TetR family transcriptional regulator C-terminal domain-containing protein [Streptomyces sp. NPDC002928]|uniref:TetR family transcriptional regulator C-terminal domain-containing protein n=1 Tax=Streptomyces sp. NPDC002928 TaxID=3154440 RepID=UPI0033AE0AB6
MSSAGPRSAGRRSRPARCEGSFAVSAPATGILVHLLRRLPVAAPRTRSPSTVPSATGRLIDRVDSIPRSAGWARAVLLESLPLDESRRLEMEVSLAFGIAAMTDAALRDAHRAAHQAVRAICTEVADSASSATDTELEAERLHALMDGLALHLVLQEPGEDSAWAVRALDAHLNALL